MLGDYICVECMGTGHIWDPIKKETRHCEECHGTGKLPVYIQCSECGGSGEQYDKDINMTHTCYHCDGLKFVVEFERFF